MTRMRKPTPQWAKELPPAGVGARQCQVTYLSAVCGGTYLDYPGGHEAHNAVFGHWPQPETNDKESA
jgi:hypothetical protein